MYTMLEDTNSEFPITYSMQLAAKLQGGNIGRTKLFKKLRSLYILDAKNLPYQKYKDLGYFKVISKIRYKPKIKCDFVTIVTEKGLEFIRKILTSPDPTFTLNSTENEQ